jgi:hypothetical protein
VKDNAFYGFLYSSSDGGKSWHVALEDKSTTWVTEQSCAFGVSGKAYFVSEASRVVDGQPHHDEGTTRMFVSNDAGGTWGEAAKTRWADYSSSVVDVNPGAHQNQLYTFFNTAGFDTPTPEGEKLDRPGTRIGLITFKDGDEQVEGPIVNRTMDGLGYKWGSFPQKVFLLRDGSLLCIFYAVHKAEKGSELVFGAIRTNRDRDQLAAPVIAARASIRYDKEPCFGDTAAYDSRQGRVYLAYHAFENGQCRFMLTSSEDGGSTWSKLEHIAEPMTLSHRLYDPAMVFNRDGVLGLMWRDEQFSDCWYFSASTDRAKTFIRARPLSQCSNRHGASLTLSNAFLAMEGVVYDSSQSRPVANLGLHVVNHRNAVFRNASSLTATSDGVFHPVWIEAGSDAGQLRTAAVKIGPSEAKTSISLPAEKRSTRDISRELKLLYGGDEHYDMGTGVLSVRIVLRNKSDKAISAPLLLRVDELTGGLGQVEIENSDNGLSGLGAVWDLSSALRNGVLEAGATTEAYPLVFRITLNKHAPPRDADVLLMKLTALAVPLKPR